MEDSAGDEVWIKGVSEDLIVSEMGEVVETCSWVEAEDGSKRGVKGFPAVCKCVNEDGNPMSWSTLRAVY
jgi:hypothetical protein